jgi:component factor B
MRWGQRQEAASINMVPILLFSGGQRRDLEIEEVLFHPKYNINGKKAEGIPEFYDYDVALVKLKNKLKYGQTLR